MDELEAEQELAIQQMLELHGIAYNEETSAHMRLMLECVRVYDSRAKSYGEVWKQYGALSNLLSVARKVDRLMGSWWFRGKGVTPALHKDSLDDAVDLVNYALFFMRNAVSGNLVGHKPERPEGD